MNDLNLIAQAVEANLAGSAQSRTDEKSYMEYWNDFVEASNTGVEAGAEKFVDYVTALQAATGKSLKQTFKLAVDNIATYDFFEEDKLSVARRRLDQERPAEVAAIEAARDKLDIKPWYRSLTR